MTPSPRCAKPQRFCDSRHQLQHPVPGCCWRTPSSCRGISTRALLPSTMPRALPPKTCRTKTHPSCGRWRLRAAQIAERAATITGQLPGYAVNAGKDYVVVTLAADGNHAYPGACRRIRGRNRASPASEWGPQCYEIRSASRINDVAITGTVSGTPFTAQVGGTPNPLWRLRLQHNGTHIDALVISPAHGRTAPAHAARRRRHEPLRYRPCQACWWTWQWCRGRRCKRVSEWP